MYNRSAPGLCDGLGTGFSRPHGDGLCVRMNDPATLWTLFGSSLLASTVLPGGSEALLFLAASQATAGVAVLWLTATAGNTLGGLITWGIGRWLAWRFPDKWPRKPAHRRALDRIRCHGSPVLILSWLPVVGDPLCLAAGSARIAVLPAALFMALGKGLRYAVLLLPFAQS